MDEDSYRSVESTKKFLGRYFSFGQKSKRLYKHERSATIRREATRNLICLFLAVCAVLLSVSIFKKTATRYKNEQSIQSMNMVSEQICETFTNHVNSFFDELDIAGQFIATHHDDIYNENGETTVFNCLKTVQYELFDQIGVLTPAGDVMLSSGQKISIADISGVKYFITHEDTIVKMYFSPDDNSALGEYIIYAVRPKKSEYDLKAVSGYVGLVKKDTISELLTTTVFGDTKAYAFVTDWEGNIVVASDPESIIGNNVINALHNYSDKDMTEKIKQDFIKGNTSIDYYHKDGTDYVMYYTSFLGSKSQESDLVPGRLAGTRLAIFADMTSLGVTITSLLEESQVLYYVTIAIMFVVIIAICAVMSMSRKKVLVYESLDSVTGLLNFGRFKRDANLIISSRPESYAVVSVNIVHFKMINEILGHDKADDVLYTFGQSIQCVLNTDEIAARLFSDRFLVLFNIKNTNIEDRIKELQQEIISAEYPVGIRVEPTFGVYCLQNGDSNIIPAIDHAKFAQDTYNARFTDTYNIAYYDNELFEKQKMDAILEKEAFSAIENREFVVYYQMKRSRTGWSGCEALVRWNHKKYGLLTPAAFIDLFERTQFIVRLDEYVFDTVCSDLRQSIDAGLNVVPVSVNLSKCHLNDLGFPEFFAKALEKYDIPANLIEFEVTESMMINDKERMHKVISEIEGMGCHCALDDFGKGYASFDIVRNFKFKTLKLDSSFFRGGNGFDESAQTMVEMLIELAHKLGMEVVAEGVETEEQSTFLFDRNCDNIQGYYYAKPLPYEEIRNMIDVKKI